jgi:hypothetical protein
MLLVSCWFPGLTFDPQDGNKIFLRNVDELPHYMESHLTNWTLHIHHRETLKSNTTINQLFYFVIILLLLFYFMVFH